MILIADSGSTKADWVLLDDNLEKVNTFKTMGFNPFFHDEVIISNVLKQTIEINAIAPKVKRVYFYGAGCSSEELCQKMQDGLQREFENADIVVDHDLLACAYATYKGVPNISCILGTGSNSCYFDGETLIEEIPALAYVLGDEGSGSYFGKKLLADYLYKKLPEEIAAAFDNEFGFTKDQIFERVYSDPNPNVFLASFMKFISQFKEHEYIDDMVYRGMKHFIEIHILCYKNYKDVPVHFIGSLAFHFNKPLQKAASELEVQLGNVIKKPIENLVEYHKKYVDLVST